MNHGTHSGYTRHRQIGEPSCGPCLEANAAYHRDWRVRKGLNKNVDPEPARRHIATLLANGGTLRGIAEEAGMNVRQVGDVWRGNHASIWPETEARILAVQRGWSLYIPAAGSIRRIEALRRMGWTVEYLGDRLGVTFQAVHHIGRQKRVHRDRAEAIAALYDELSMTPGPSSILRKRAETKGYVPPLAWDDDTIDDPGAWADLGSDDVETVDPIKVERLLAGWDWRALDATKAERIAAAEEAIRRPGTVLTDVERSLGLRAGRDFRRTVAA